MTDWIDGTESTLVADDCFHSGAATELIRSNLIKAQNSSGIHIASHHFDGDVAIAQTPGTAEEFEIFSNFNAIAWPLRLAEDAITFRTLTLYLDGKADSGTGTVRIYPRRNYRDTLSLDVTDGFLDQDTYAEFTFSSSSFVTANDTVTPDVYISPIAPESGVEIPMVFFVAIVSASVPDVVTVRNLRIVEAPT